MIAVPGNFTHPTLLRIALFRLLITGKNTSGRRPAEIPAAGSLFAIAQSQASSGTKKPRRGFPPGAHFVSFNFANRTFRRFVSTRNAIRLGNYFSAGLK